MNIFSLRNTAPKKSTNAGILTFALLVTLVGSEPTYAFMWTPSQLQYDLMPDHCKARMSDHHRNRNRSWAIRLPINEQEISYWKKKVGPDWPHMHHYCGGLGWLMLAESPTMQRRQGKSRHWGYRQADHEISYTINKSSPSSPIWIEMNIAQARARAGLGNLDQALAQFLALQKLAPNRSDVYIEMAKVQKRSGKTEDAIVTLEEGMRKASQKGPILFYLARYYYDVGDLEKARELTASAERQGMKMDSLKQRLGKN